MVARVARFEGVNVQEAEKIMDEAEEIIRPIVEGLSGFQGYLELMGSGGEMLSITFFDSDENAAAAESTFDEELPRRLGDFFTRWEGRRVAVGRYRVLADERR
jgi:hypothetical protein